MKILTFAGSLRTESLNKKNAKEALRFAQELGHTGEFVDLRDFAIPVYDGDDEEKNGAPEGVKKLGEKIAAADALIISTPEYNYSMPGALKNVVDWLSRLKPAPLAGKPLLLLGASPGALSAVRGMTHSKVAFDSVGMHVFPTLLGLGTAGEAFDAQGRLKDEKKAKALKDLVEKFAKHVGK